MFSKKEPTTEGLMKSVVSLFILFILMFSSKGFAVDEKSVAPAIDASFSEQLALYPFPHDIEGKPSRFVYLRKLLEISSGSCWAPPES